MALPGEFRFYANNIDVERMADLLGATVKVMLVTAAYAVDDSETGHSIKAQITNELPAGNGYTAGGEVVANKAITAVPAGFKFSSDNVFWFAIGAPIPVWRRAVFYVSGVLWGLTDPLIGHFLGDRAPADAPATQPGMTVILACPADGWFDNKRT